MKLRYFLITILMLLSLTAAPLTAPAKGWEVSKTERADARQAANNSDIEIKTARGVIIVTTNHPSQIKVFTILGQLVSSENLPTGTFQFSVPAHGVYIIKAGDLTCKAAL
ncbi:MAG: T9SS type A sorting domain-containing protein [Muribaculaceae bacterium]|nr:T9SS type A sorting domain-containing protein [Muribaculaceae bacterium]